MQLAIDQNEGKDLSESFSSGIDDPEDQVHTRSPDPDGDLVDEDDVNAGGPYHPNGAVDPNTGHPPSNGTSDLLTVLSSVSSLLPPASPLEKRAQARQRAAEARERDRKQRNNLAPPSASPIPPTPLPPSAQQYFYRPYMATPGQQSVNGMGVGAQTPFMSPSAARPTGGDAPSPGFAMFATPQFLRSGTKLIDPSMLGDHVAVDLDGDGPVGVGSGVSVNGGGGVASAVGLDRKSVV